MATMTKRIGQRAALLVALGWLITAAGPFAYTDLPKNLPERRPGLWEVHTLGELSGEVKTYEERSRICVNVAVDRELYREELDNKRMTVVMMDGDCNAPSYTFDGHKLSATMQCESRGVEGGPRAVTRFQATTTYVSPDKVISEHKRVDHNHIVFDGESTYRETMTRIGDCEAGQKPGDRVRIESRMNGQEIQKSMNTDNIFDAAKTGHKLIEDLQAAHQRINDAFK